MQITRLPDTLDDLLVDAGPVRTPGLHLSQIIRSILQSLEPAKYKSGPINTLYTEPGFVFERVLETHFQARRIDIFRPEEIEVDGIIMSPDGILIDDYGELWLEEFKSTDMNMVGCPTDPKFRKWIWQIGAYCKACGTTKAHLRVMWWRGNYKEIRRAYTVDAIEFTQDEIENIWTLLVDHARQKGWLVMTPEGLKAAA